MASYTNRDIPVPSGIIMDHEMRTGVTLNTSGGVTAVLDQSGGVQHLGADSANPLPLYRNGGTESSLVWDQSQAAYRSLKTPGTASFTNTSYSQYLVLQHLNNPDGTASPGTYGLHGIAGTDISGGLGAELVLSDGRLHVYSGTERNFGDKLPPVTPYVLGMRGGTADSRLRVQDQVIVGSALNGSSGTTVYLGKLGNGFSTGGNNNGFNVFRHILYNRTLSDSEDATMAAWLASRHSHDLTPTHVVIFDGDSLTYGFRATLNRTYPQQVRLPSNVIAYNTGQGSAGVSGRQTQMASTLPLIVRSTCTNIVVVMIGVNDMLASRTGAVTYAALQSYVATLRANGVNKVIVCTTTPVHDFAAETLNYNNFIRAGWASFADALVDIAADDRIGKPGTSELSTAYFDGDQIHLNNDGYGVLAKLVQDKLTPFVTTTTAATIISAINADATQAAARTNAATASNNTGSLLSGQATLLNAVANLNNLSALANLFGPHVLEIPDTGTTQYSFTLTIKDTEGHLIAADATPTISVVNSTGTSRSGNLSAVTTTGNVYTFTYGVASTAVKEGLQFTANASANGSARRADFGATIADYDEAVLLAAIAASAAAAATSSASADNKASTINTNIATLGSVVSQNASQVSLNTLASVVAGKASQASVNTLAASLASGNGDVLVDHNYGGTDVNRVTFTGQGVDDVTITAYDATAYAANATTAAIIDQVKTGSDGRWATPMRLSAGTYTLYFSKPGAFQAFTKSLVVT